MKKTLFICILVLVLCVSLFVACNKETPLDAETLEAMITVIDMNNRNNAKETPVDYQLPGTVVYAGQLCKIKWTATNGVTVSEPDEAGYVTFDVNEEAPQDIEYKITATLVNSKNEEYKKEDGTTYSISFDRVTKAFVISTYDEYIANCKAATADTKSINIKAYVIAIILPSSGSSSKGSMYLQDKDGHGYYAYAPTLASGLKDSDAKILAEYPYGTEVYVSGTSTVYSGQYEFDKNCAIRKTGNVATAEELKFVDGSADFAAAGDNKDNALIPYQNAMVELKDCTMTRVTQQGGKDVYFWFKVGNSNVEFNLYKTNYFMSESDADNLVKNFVVGDKATFKGVVSVYSNSYQIYPLGLEAISNVKHIEYTDAEKAEMDKANLSLTTTKIASVDTKVTLPSKGTAFESTITWALKEGSTLGAIADGKYGVEALPKKVTTVTLVATIKQKNATVTKEFEIEVSQAFIPGVIDLTVDSLGLVQGSYSSKDPKAVTINGLALAYTGTGNYGNGVQMRYNHKDTGTSTIYNTTAATKDIISITFTANGSVPDGSYKENNLKLEYGATDALGSEKLVSLKKGDSVTVTLEAGVKFIKISHNNQGAVYLDKITILLEGAELPSPEAKIGTIEYDTLAEALEDAAANDTIVLLKDVKIDTTIVITKKITLDLNGKTISSDNKIWGTAQAGTEQNNWSMISVQAGGDLTINGNGKVIAKEGDLTQENASCYALDVRAAGAKLTINAGEYVGNRHCVYVLEGSVIINGGKYSIYSGSTNDTMGYKFVLNLQDANGAAKTATISVTGGSFVNYDPSHSASENPVANFVAEGYVASSKTEGTGDAQVTIWTVNPATEHAGTQADPYSAADVKLVSGTLANNEKTETVYIKGYVLEAGYEEYSTQYKNMTFYINDTATGEKLVKVYRVKLATGVEAPKAGEIVIIKGQITVYNGEAQIASGAEITVVEEAASTTAEE